MQSFGSAKVKIFFGISETSLDRKRLLNNRKIGEGFRFQNHVFQKLLVHEVAKQLNKVTISVINKQHQMDVALPSVNICDGIII